MVIQLVRIAGVIAKPLKVASKTKMPVATVALTVLLKNKKTKISKHISPI